MERKAALRRASSGASYGIGPSPSSRLECELSLRLIPGDTLILVLLLSLGLWALIWAVVSLFAAWELRWA
jgi:hypothetical protein